MQRDHPTTEADNGRSSRLYRDYPDALVPIDYSRGHYTQYYWWDGKVWVLARQKLAEILGAGTTDELLTRFAGKQTSLLCVCPRSTEPTQLDNVHHQTVLPLDAVEQSLAVRTAPDLITYFADARQHVLDRVYRRVDPTKYARPRATRGGLRAEVAELRAEVERLRIYKDWYDTIRSIAAISDPILLQERVDDLLKLARLEG